MRRSTMLALGLAMMIPVMGAAQERDRGPREGRAMPGGAVALILDSASALSLTESQVTALRGIQARFDEQTAPLRARADSLRPSRTEERPDRGAMRERRQAAGQLMSQLREANQSARTEALAVLTPEQQRQVERIEAARRKQFQDRRGRRGPGPRADGAHGARGHRAGRG